MNPNVLRQWMQMYDQQGMGARYADDGTGRFVPVRDDNRGAARLMFAERMAGMGGQDDGPPDFFGGEQPFNALAAYRQPAGFQSPAPMPERPMRRNPNVLRARMGG